MSSKVIVKFRGNERIVKQFCHIKGQEFFVEFWNGDQHVVTIEKKINCWINGSQRIIKSAQQQSGSGKWSVTCWNGDKFTGKRIAA